MFDRAVHGYEPRFEAAVEEGATLVRVRYRDLRQPTYGLIRRSRGRR